MHPAAVIIGITARVWSPGNVRHTASKEETYSYPQWKLCYRTNLVDPKWALTASLTGAVLMVSVMRPETSMINWLEAGGQSVPRGGGGCWGHVCRLSRDGCDWGLKRVRPRGWLWRLGGGSQHGPRGGSRTRRPWHRERCMVGGMAGGGVLGVGGATG